MTAVLALQGAFAEHEKMLSRLGEESFEIRQKKDLDRPFDRLIIPGGESTVMGKLINELGLFDTIRSRIEKGMPVFGTCAGLILLAKLTSDNNVYLGTMSVKAERNAYGRQLGSFYTEENFAHSGKIPMTFIRAPFISETFDDTETLSKVDGKVVAARQKNMLVTAFHPELGDCTAVHEYFLNMK